MAILARPGESLRDHLEACIKIYDEEFLFLKKLDPKFYEDLRRAIGIHDIGKASPAFQSSLKSEGRESLPHSPLSAFLYYSLSKDLYGFYAILRHHQDLIPIIGGGGYNLEEGIRTYEESPGKISKVAKAVRKNLEEKGEDLIKFLEETLEIRKEDLIKGLRSIEEERSFKFLLKDIKKEILKIAQKERSRSFLLSSDPLSREFIEAPWWKFRYSYSALKYCDVLSIARVMSAKRSGRGALDRLLSYSSKLGSKRDPLTNLRRKFFETCTKRMKEALKGELKKFYVVNAPTGIGKTLANIAISLMLGEKIEEEYGKFPKIVYALPFTSIADQVYEVVKEALGDRLEIALLHNYRAEVSSENESPEVKAFLAASMWQGDLLVTTFEQLIYSILWGKKNYAMKFSLANPSVAILDEVQAIEPALLVKVREGLRSSLLTYYIVSTATLPERIINKEESYIIFSLPEAIRLSRKICPKISHRVRYFSEIAKDLQETPKIEDIVEWSLQVLEKENPRSAIFLLNTIRSSKEFAKKIEKKAEELGYLLFYLSSRVIPKDRLRRIEEIRSLKNSDEKYLLVTTQVIEAGVDISSDILVRDLGPLEAIVQAAGRCNRELEREFGKVYLREIFQEERDGNLRKISSRVYCPSKINEAEKVLKDLEPGTPQADLEKKIIESLRSPSYDNSPPKEFFEKLLTLDVKYFEKEVELIKDDFSIPVFVEADRRATALLWELEELYERIRKGEREGVFDKFKLTLKKCRPYMVDLKVYQEPEELSFLSTFPPEGNRAMFYVLKRDSLGAYYDETYGFGSKGLEEDIF